MQGEGNERVEQTPWTPRPVTHHKLVSHLRVKMRPRVQHCSLTGQLEQGQCEDCAFTFPDEDLLSQGC